MLEEFRSGRNGCFTQKRLDRPAWLWTGLRSQVSQRKWARASPGKSKARPRPDASKSGQAGRLVVREI